MSSYSKPEIIVTIKLRNITISDLTVQELHGLYNALSELIDVPVEEEYEEEVEPLGYPWDQPMWHANNDKTLRMILDPTGVPCGCGCES